MKLSNHKKPKYALKIRRRHPKADILELAGQFKSRLSPVKTRAKLETNYKRI